MDHGPRVVGRRPDVSEDGQVQLSRGLDLRLDRCECHPFFRPCKMYDHPAFGLHVCAVLQLHLREIVPGQYHRDLISRA